MTEDIEYHMTLLLAGERVEFAPDATLEAEMPGTLQIIVHPKCALGKRAAAGSPHVHPAPGAEDDQQPVSLCFWMR